MGCCKPPAPWQMPATNQASFVPSLAARGGGEFMRIKYIGGNVGSETYGGPGVTPSGRYYYFGANDSNRFNYVEDGDAKYFLNYKERGMTMFEQVEDLPVEEAQPAQTAKPGEGTDNSPANPSLTVETVPTIEGEKPAPEEVPAEVVAEDNPDLLLEPELKRSPKKPMIVKGKDLAS